MIDKRLRRHELGFLEVADRPTAEELADYYANNYYQFEKGNYRESYPAEELEVIGLNIAQRIAHAASFCAYNGPGRFLDVGCGEGFVLAAMASKSWQVEGIDHSISGVEALNPRMLPHVQQGDLFRLLEDRINRGVAYDLVWLGNVLEHVLDPVGLLNSLRGLVAEGGLLVCTVPNDGNAYHERLLADRLIDGRFWIAVPDHMSYFTVDSLTRLVEATGWICRDVQGDFPVDFFLAHEGSNYVTNPGKGRAAHQARLRLEYLIGVAGETNANQFYSALAGVGLGRNITAYLSPS
jgi:SAM-dependent methyltransferase